MIEYFRHEVLNQISVISGFCEIIEHQLLKYEFTENDPFSLSLKKVRQLVGNFHSTLMVFREGCILQDVTEAIIMNADTADSIEQYLTPECRVQYEVLLRIAEALNGEAMVMRKSSSANEKMTERSAFIESSAERLLELFRHPVAYLQKTLKLNHQNENYQP